MDYYSILRSLILGLVVGLLFTWFNLPIPAPDNLSAIFGIIGIFSGMVAIRYWKSLT